MKYFVAQAMCGVSLYLVRQTLVMRMCACFVWVPTFPFVQVLDVMLVWSRSVDTAVNLCEKQGGMTEIAIKHFQVS